MLASPTRIGMIGIGGWAQTHLATLRTLHRSGLCRLVAVADPTADRFPAIVAALDSEGIPCYDNHHDLLSRSDIDAVVISTPIPLHASQTVDALNAGKHVYLEKPPCATTDQLNRMETARAASGKICAVGFQKQTQGCFAYVRSLITSGKLGQVTNLWSGVRWPRDDAYYSRSQWAGKLMFDGEAVIDGPATNALSHIVQAGLSFIDAPSRIRGCLRHARPIESYDASYIEVDTVSRVNARFFLSHATDDPNPTILHIVGTEGKVAFNWNFEVTVSIKGEAPQVLSFPCLEWMGVMLDFVVAIGRGGMPATTLSDTLPFIQAINGALISGGSPGSFPVDMISTVHTGTDKQVYTVRGLDDEMDAFVADCNRIPSLLTPGSWVAVGDIARSTALI